MIRNSYQLTRPLSLFLVLAANSTPQVSSAHDYEIDLPSKDSVAISVLGLFHPKEFIVRVLTGHALILQTGDHSIVLENSQVSSANIRLNGSDLVVTLPKEQLHAESVKVASRTHESADFILEIPGKIKRGYRGELEIRPSAGTLLAVANLDLETAVASVVAAESAPDTSVEALKAYAIAARSYFVAGRGRHRSFDFCDTTHCQFLRMAPPSTSLVAQATEATEGLVLKYQSRPFAAMYTRSCSGHTRTPAQVGIPAADYPYYSVECDYCRQHPVHWTSYLSVAEAASLRPSNEGTRLAVARRLGWNAVPSNEFSLRKKGDHVLLTGVGNGHGIGLCQAGAKAMADTGASFREILDHYYPNAAIVQYSGRNPLI